MTLRADAVVLDVDGVLVDVEGSYRRAIVESVRLVLGDSIPKESIQSFKNSGGFNNDWELSYAAAAYVLATRVGYDGTADSFAALFEGVDGGYNSLSTVLEQVVGTRGKREVERALDTERIRSIFQWLYLGEDLYMELEDGNPPDEVTRVTDSGYIHDEPVIIREETIAWLCDSFAVGVITGRPKAEANIALDRVSLQLPEHHRYTMDDWSAGKPDPAALITLATRFEATDIAYIGDTVDDIMTAVNADSTDSDRSYYGVGVLSGGLSGQTGRSTFEQAGSTLVVDSVNDLPGVLEPI